MQITFYASLKSFQTCLSLEGVKRYLTFHYEPAGTWFGMTTL